MRVPRALLALLPALGTAACSDSVDSTGFVVMGKWSPDPDAQVWAAAAFHRGLDQGLSNTVAKEADCTLTASSDLGGSAATDPGTGVPTYEFLDAGAVTITADQTITMVRGNDGSYTLGTSTYSSVFHAGQTVTVEIAGNHGDPPEVSLTYAAPGQLEVTQPTDSAFTFDRTQDASFTWTATDGNSVYLFMMVEKFTLTCEWPMADQKGTVPASLLSRLPQATTTATLSAQTMHEENHGRWRIRAGAGGYGKPVDVTLR